MNLTHSRGIEVLSAFTYTLDAVGNRIQAVETIREPGGRSGRRCPGRGYPPSLLVNSPDHAYGQVCGLFLGVGEIYGDERYTIPVARFSAEPLSGTVPLTVTFTNQSNGEITAYEWAFGDGMTDTITHPVHVYTTMGVYTVSLTATGPGGTDTLTKTNYVTATAPPVVETRVITYTLRLRSGQAYDPLYRLTGATYSTGESFAYAYDAVGNRLAMTTSNGSTSYEYDAAALKNRLLFNAELRRKCTAQNGTLDAGVDIVDDLADFIARQMAERGLSLRALAMYSGTGVSTLSDIVRRQRRAKPVTCRKLGDYFGSSWAVIRR